MSTQVFCSLLACYFHFPLQFSVNSKISTDLYYRAWTKERYDSSSTINIWRFHFKSSLSKINFRHDFHDDEVFPKVLYKTVLLAIIKIPDKSVLLSIITCRHLSYPRVLKCSIIEAFYYLAKRDFL